MLLNKGIMEYDRSRKMFDEPHSPEDLDKAVDEKIINTGKFLSKAHLESYQLQMRTIRNLKDVKKVLEIGPGEAFCARNLRELGYDYHTLDFNDTYSPTIVADFSKYDPTSTERYDLTCAFQVLEHFPYNEFLTNLQKLRELSDKYVFISLPYSCFGFSININFQLGQSLRLDKRLNFYLRTMLTNRKYREEFKKEFPWAVHYWEIGRRGYKLSKVLGDIKSCNLKILKRFHSPNPFHYFILCEK
jgi:Methyltransferase domain